MIEAKITATGALIAGVLAAVGASICCAVPLLLVTLGLGGTWIARLTVLEPLRPFWLAATALFFGLASWQLYRRPQVCEPGPACADPAVKRRQRALFWTLGAIVLVLVAFPWYGPLLF